MADNGLNFLSNISCNTTVTEHNQALEYSHYSIMQIGSYLSSAITFKPQIPKTHLTAA